MNKKEYNQDFKKDFKKEFKKDSKKDFKKDFKKEFKKDFKKDFKKEFKKDFKKDSKNYYKNKNYYKKQRAKANYYKKQLIKKLERKEKKFLNKKNFYEIFIKRNPYVLIRKNYKILFRKFFNNRNITPLFFKFLHLAYFKININNIYRPRLIHKIDSYAKKIYRYNIFTFKNFKFSPYQYFFVLMKKKTHLQKIFELYNRNSVYVRQLHQLYYFQKAKKADFSEFTYCPKYLHINTKDQKFNELDALRPYEYKYIRKVINFFYPVTEIHFRESNIHGKPMKTKLPRRI